MLWGLRSEVSLVSEGAALDVVSDFASARQDWTRLAELAGNIFGTWEWAEAWHRHMAPRGRLRIAPESAAGDGAVNWYDAADPVAVR